MIVMMNKKLYVIKKIVCVNILHIYYINEYFDVWSGLNKPELGPCLILIIFGDIDQQF